MKIVKMSLAIMLVLCVLKMPYGYYQFVRVATCVAACYLAYEERKNTAIMLGCIGVSILFNPIFKVYLNKHTWNIIDVAIGVVLLIWLSYDFIKNYRKQDH